MSDLTQPNSRKRGASSFAYRLLCSASVVSGIIALGTSAAHGSDLHWDSNGTAVSTGGTGAWDLSGLNWSPSGDGVSGPYSAWNNGALDNAIFGGAGGTVTLGLPITVQNLTFSSAYTLTGSTLTLVGTTPTITTTHGINTTTTVNSILAGSAGLTKAGNGTLRLTGTNNFSGTISVLAGRLSVASDASLGALSNSILTANGASVAVRIDGASTGRSIVIGDGGTLTLEGTGVTSALISGNGRVSLANGVTLGNDSNSYTGRTTFNGVNGVANNYFTSIGNLGELSSLGAPVTVSDGTIIFDQSSQYSDNVIYLGDGDSSNRKWEIYGASASIRNRGSGTLSITGSILSNGGSVFFAETADIELLGTLNGTGNFAFNTDTGRTIRLGSSNSFSGRAGIAGLVEISMLADIGSVSSLGSGSTIALTAGALDYRGAGSSSDRLWTVSDASSILNNGSGALGLTGSAEFVAGGAVDQLTLGGSYSGENTFSGIISGAGHLIGDGAGTWVIGGENSFTGTVTANAGTLRVAHASALGQTTGLIVNGGTLDLGGYNLTAPSLTGSGGTLALGSGTLTVAAVNAQSFAGNITGTGGLTKAGAGTLTLRGESSYTGSTTIAGGALSLNFSGAELHLDNILSASSPVILSGGALEVRGANNESNSQTFGGVTVSAGSNTIRSVSGTNGTVDLNLGAITRAGGLVNFVLPTSGSMITTNANGVLGGWATINGSDYAKVMGGTILAFDASDYSDKDNAALWLDGDIVSDTGNAANTPFIGEVGSSIQLGGLRYTAAANSAVTIANGATLGVDGTIIVAPSALATNQSITSGSLTGGANGATLGFQHNGTGTFTVNSTIVDNGGATGFTKGGTGTLALASSVNSYTGATVLTGGTLRFGTIADGGVVSSIGASSADSSNLVIEAGTLQYAGATATTDRGFTLVNGGTSRVIEVSGGTNLTFTGEVTSPDQAGFTKMNAGTLTLANAANSYVGVTEIGGGVLSVNTLSNGGLASGIGAADSGSSNLLFANAATLQYTGATTTIDRGFTLNSGGGRIDVANAATTLRINGVATGAAAFYKSGAGTLILGGTNNHAGQTIVEAGTLRAGSASAFGTGPMSVETGATLHLGGFNITTTNLAGAGTVDLGGNTFTTTGATGVFTGRITGTGGFTRGAGSPTQALRGCNSDYTGVTTIIGSLSIDCIANGGVSSSIGASGAASSNLVLNNGTLTYSGANAVTDRGFAMPSSAYLGVSDAATTLEFQGVVAGSGRLFKDGAGTLVLSGNNTYSGATRVRSGVLIAGSSQAFGAAAGMTVDDTAGVLLDLAGFNTSVSQLDGGGANGGNIALNGATLTITAGAGSTTPFYGGAISGAGNIIKNGTGTQRFTNCGSDYTGTTTINGGVLVVTCLPNGGVASSIGTSGAGAVNLILNGGTLRYAGAGESTDRQFTIGSSAGSALDASGTGAINFTSTAALTFAAPNIARALTLTGTSTDDNRFAAQITNNGTGQTALTKTGTGTWILTNAASTYTGISTISGGVLGVDKLSDGGVASSIGMSSAAASNLVIGNGSTLRYTGTGDTTNRLFTLSSGVTYIESSGTGAIVFTDTGPVTLQGNNQARTIALGGTNADNNTLAGAIGNAGTGVTTLAKNDSGTWVLTGNHSYTGSTNINAGLLSIGGGGTTGSIASAVLNNFGALAFNRSDTLTYGGSIVGTGGVHKDGTGTTILTGTSSYTGGTTVNTGLLQLGEGGVAGSIVGDVLNNSQFAFNRSNLLTFDGVISGSGVVRQDGTGTTVLTAVNSYTGGTEINAGTLQISSDGNLGDASGLLTINGATLRTATTLTSGRDVVLTGNATMLTDAGTSFTLGGVASGADSLTKTGNGSLILTAANSHTGGTTISAGTLSLGNGGTGGSIVGDVLNNGNLVFNRSNALGFTGLISGTGTVTQNGSGVVTLTASNSYKGATTLNAGTLLINGDQSVATGLTTVNAGATLGGSGIIGGSVFVADGGILSPGNSPGTLTLAGDLTLSDGSVLNFEFGAADVVGGPLNDLVEVGGNLVLDGTLNVSVPVGGSFGSGIYRVFNYAGTLTDNGLSLGLMPTGAEVALQVAIPGQVNLVNLAGAALNFWDGGAGPRMDGIVNGGDGIWQLLGPDENWTTSTGMANATYADGSFAIFSGAAGDVVVSNDNGAVTAAGLQFASSGYQISGDAITLTGDEAMIRVGDGSAAGAAFTATISAELGGTAQLVKSDLGTLILSGANSYSGGTVIDGGTLRISNDLALGAAAGGVSFNGGTLNTAGSFTTGRAFTLTSAGNVQIDGGTELTLTGGISGGGALTKSGSGTLTLDSVASHSGGTTIAAGILQVGNGGTTGDITGNILNNDQLIFRRSADRLYTGAVSGSGSLTQTGSAVLSMTGASTYTGATFVYDGTLALVNGGSIEGTSHVQIADASMLVDGVGTRLVTALAGTSTIAQSAGSTGTLTVQNGGYAEFGALELAGGPLSDGTLIVMGAGSQVRQRATSTFGSQGAAFVSILDGGTMTTTANATVGATANSTGEGTVVVSGEGSQWTVTGDLLAGGSSISVSDGGVITAGTAVIGYSGAPLLTPSTTLSVSGAGSVFETVGGLSLTNNAGATASITMQDSGLVRVGSGTMNLGLGEAVINIGGAEGSAAASAGLLQADQIVFTAASNRVNFNHVDTEYEFAAVMTGLGAVLHNGPGTTILTGDNSYAGPTTINAGTLLINGDQSGSTGTTFVNSGGTLGGLGTIGADVQVALGGTINPGGFGSAPGKLAIGGALTLQAGSSLDFNFGQANVVGGPLNDLIEVSGDLVLNGTLNVQTSGGGSFDPGLYRVISYAGTSTNNGLTLGTVPSADFYLQTSVPGQINLVNTAGMSLRFWDGNASPRNDGVVDGGGGTWENFTGNDNWTEEDGAINASFNDGAFAVFMGTAGTVTVDDSLGAINVAGMQFLTDGYIIQGDPITLVGSDATIRLGDGTAAGAGVTVTIGSELAGSAGLVKSDLGTLILTGENSYTGGTTIKAGVLQIANDLNLGDAAGGLTFESGTLQTTTSFETARAVALIGAGTVMTDASTIFGFTGAISGAGGLIKDGAGTLILSGPNTYSAATTVNAGELYINGDQSGAAGLTTVAGGAMLGGNGTIGGGVMIADGARLDPGLGDDLPGSLRINGGLTLAAGATLSMQFGEANTVGGALNDLIEVGGDLTLDGTLDVRVTAGGTYGPGIYRLINYDGTLTDNGLTLGLTPGGSTNIVQTSVAGQINLVNTDGRLLNFWDGQNGPKFNGLIEGGDGIWQNSTGNDNWADATGTVNAGFADGSYAIFAGTGGAVTINNALGQVIASDMQFAADGYALSDGALELTGPQSTIQVGDGSLAGASFTATIAADLFGSTQLVKTDSGTLILSGSNSYTGGTSINGGTLAISADSNLGGASGELSLFGGTLQATADLVSDRAVSFAGSGTILTDASTTLTLTGTLSGPGALIKDGAGTLVLSGMNAGYTAATDLLAGTLVVNGLHGGTISVSGAGRLEGTGQVGGMTNSGIVAPGHGGIGVLTVAGDYVGNGGMLQIEAALGADNSATDKLVVNGATSGNTTITVLNRSSVGDHTVEGIKIVDVAGASNGVFTLNGDYLFQGEQAVVAGAFSYRLYKGGVSTPEDGDWYLRSGLTNPPVDPTDPHNPTDPTDPSTPLDPVAPVYQPGVPIYENALQTMLTLNRLPTLQQRVGNRSWAATPALGGAAIWGRSEVSRIHSNPVSSTSGSRRTIEDWRLQMGADAVLSERSDGATLIGGLTAHYGEADARVRSSFGNGAIDSGIYGVGATMTWYGPHGFYVDGQAQLSWFKTDMDSDVLGALASKVGGTGKAISIEAGKRSSIGKKISLTPQGQMTYSQVRYDRFTDAYDVEVSAPLGESLRSRGGISFDYQSVGESPTSGKARSTHLYGVVNLDYEWLKGTQTDIAGTPVLNRGRALWGGVSVGASVSWSDTITLYAEGTGETALRDFGDSYGLRGTAGVRVRF